jgi:5-methylcytosine-specific restriction endonuclease McrA
MRGSDEEILYKRSTVIYHKQKVRCELWKCKFTLDQFRKWLARSIHDNLLCPYCRDFLDCKTCQIDHKVPISRSGVHELHNLCLCCARCNRIKGMLTAEEFHALMNLLKTWHPVAGNDVLRRLQSGYAKGMKK